jgi:murein DD-endopeptidase MepM/ murein hydrolase activator NlpD
MTAAGVFALTLGILIVRDNVRAVRTSAPSAAGAAVIRALSVTGGHLRPDTARDTPAEAEIRQVIDDLGRGTDYRAVTQDGVLVGVEVQATPGAILAVRYVMPDGVVAFFRPDGQEIPISILPSPLLAPRVSSGFGRRQDPWWRRLNVHGGVDYAARVGTPVHAVADGIVQFVGSKGGYGNLVVLVHRNKMETFYGHLSGYPAGFGKGQTIRRGSVIGYVGRSGLATGPHLHFEVHENGRPRNPEGALISSAGSIPSSLKSDFFRQTTLVVDALQRDALLNK